MTPALCAVLTLLYREAQGPPAARSTTRATSARSSQLNVDDLLLCLIVLGDEDCELHHVTLPLMIASHSAFSSFSLTAHEAHLP